MVDLAITTSEVRAVAGQPTSLGTAGAAIAAGDVLYRDPDDRTYKLADANGADEEMADVAGIAVNSAASGQPVVFTPGTILLGATAAPAKGVYVLSANPGKIAPVADLASGHRIVVLGVGNGTNTLVQDISVSGITK